MYAAVSGGKDGRIAPPRIPAAHPPAAGRGSGRRPSKDLRRTLDGIMSGEAKLDYYPSAKEYLEHLDAVLDE